MSGMVGDAELLLDQPCDALASPQGRGIAVCFGAVEQPLLQLRQLLGAELWLAPGATRMSQRLGAALQRLLCPAADALLRDAEAAGDSGLAEAFIEQAQGSQAAAFESFEIAFDSSRMTHAY